MSKNVHPYAYRLVSLRNWKAQWFQLPKKFHQYLKDDLLIRKFLEKKLERSYISSMEIERKGKGLKIILKTSRPGVIIGRSGEGIEKLKSEVIKEMRRKKINIPAEFKIEVLEIPVPEADAAIMAQMVAEGLEKRLPFRRVMKQVLAKIMSVKGIKGAKIRVSGRLGGTEIARSDEVKEGNIPLQTIKADIDFAQARAHLPYGDLGIKVWIYREKDFEKKK